MHARYGDLRSQSEKVRKRENWRGRNTVGVMEPERQCTGAQLGRRYVQRLCVESMQRGSSVGNCMINDGNVLTALETPKEEMKNWGQKCEIEPLTLVERESDAAVLFFIFLLLASTAFESSFSVSALSASRVATSD